VSTQAVHRPGDDSDKALRREVVTPEGIPLGLQLAAAGDRAAGFLLDMLIMGGAMFVMGLLAVMGGADLDDSWVAPFLLLAFFLLRSFYFTFFELRWQGATPGKRVVKTRVIDADGGRLEADAIITRNLMRELEFFVPLGILLAPDSLVGPLPGWGTLLIVAWAFVVVLLPLFNKDRLRIGDIVANTCVVRAPKTVLLQDIGATAATARPRRGADYEFTPEMLGHYGIYELQVLEKVIRGRDGVPDFDAVDTVAVKIQQKIGWPKDQPVENWTFVQTFYAAMRAHLEHKMLLGKRKEDKYSD